MKQLVCLLVLTNSLYAAQSSPFKSDAINSQHLSWYVLLLLVAFFLLIFFLFYKHKGILSQSKKNAALTCIGRHGKTTVFAIEYKGQHFLLAENQQALSFCPVREISREEA